MARDKAPAFQFYPRDFLTDEKVVLMSNTETGIYIRLLSYCWLEGTLPLETSSLAHLVRMPLKQFTKLWENSVVKTCFQVEDDGRLHHKRLDKERAKQQGFSDVQAANAASRWNKARDAIAVPSESQTALPSQSPRVADAEGKEQLAEGKRKERPQFTNGRFAVHRWQAEELVSMLGAHAEAFNLDEWLMTGAYLRAEQETAVIPNWWKWLKAETLREAARRGLPIAAATEEPIGNKRIAGLTVGGQAFLDRQRRQQG